MKNFALSLLTTLLFTVNAYALNWQDHWAKAVEYCNDKNYEAAETEFNLAILSIEHNKDETHPHVYIDRARLYALQDRDTEALIDLIKGLSSDKLIGRDRVRGLVTRIMVCSRLEMNEQVLADYDAYRILCESELPKAEFTDEKVIIRNVPNSNCYKAIVKTFLLGTELCEKESDIIEYDSGIIIAKRKASTCNCNKMDIMASSESDCQWYCDKMSLAGMTWCARVFKKYGCQIACIAAVELIKDGCHWCCRKGNFYENCIQPFNNIVSYMGTPCDPYWD